MKVRSRGDEATFLACLRSVVCQKKNAFAADSLQWREYACNEISSSRKWLCNGEGKPSQTKARAYRKRFRLVKKNNQEWRVVPAVRSTLPLAVRSSRIRWYDELGLTRSLAEASGSLVLPAVLTAPIRLDVVQQVHSTSEGFSWSLEAC